MKRIIMIMLVVTLSFPAFTQQTQNLFEQLTEKYADKDGFSASQLTSDMFELYLKRKNVDEPSPVYAALKKLDNIMVISQSKLNVNPVIPNSDTQTDNEHSEIHKIILKHYKNQNYTLLKTEKRMGEDVKVYLKKNQDKIESLALITSSSVSTNLVELQGDIDLKTVSELNQAINLRGLENLYKIDNSGSAIYGLSTGRRNAFSEEQIEAMLERQRAMVEKQRDLTDEQRARIEKQVQFQAQRQMEMAEKYREMAEKYQREPIFLSYPGDTNTVYYLNGKKVKAKNIKELEKENIRSISVNKAEKEDDKTTIRVKTK